jgi:hypothetical protein
VSLALPEALFFTGIDRAARIAAATARQRRASPAKAAKTPGSDPDPPAGPRAGNVNPDPGSHTETPAANRRQVMRQPL